MSEMQDRKGSQVLNLKNNVGWIIWKGNRETNLHQIERESALRPIFFALIGRNLTGEFMREIYVASWNLFTLTAEADRICVNLRCS